MTDFLARPKRTASPSLGQQGERGAEHPPTGVSNECPLWVDSGGSGHGHLTASVGAKGVIGLRAR